MRIHLIAVCTRMPAWVTEGFNDYARRLPRECSLELKEIAPGRRGRSGTEAQARREEGRLMLAALPKDCLVIALDVAGTMWDTPALARQLEGWMAGGRDVALLVGGPDGLDDACLQRADRRWSLSALTCPHALVRVIVAEQLYRAWTILVNHPYHRA